MMDDELDVSFIENITPDVLAVLQKSKFYERLDDLFCPADGTVPTIVCNQYEHSTVILNELGFDRQEIEEIKQVMNHNGGHCDCEILYNVAQESRLKSNYWTNKASQMHHQQAPN